jgi:phytoene dehydrogenase-like protein
MKGVKKECDVIIIGAGIAGLAAGCYAQMNSYKTKIFELHDKPGGVCTSWKRKGYTIDGCLHWLVGSSPASNFYKIWEKLGAVQGRRMIYHEVFMRVEGKEGKAFNVYTDLDRLEQHMKELAPQDSDVIEEFIKDIHACNSPEILKVMEKWKSISVQDFANRFKDPFLRKSLPFPPESPIIGLLMPLAMVKSAGWPIGGSLEFSRAIERRYLGLGGEIHYRSPVTKILVENNQAVGVRLADGTEHLADWVISAADGHATIFDMLDGKYINDTIRGYYDNLPLFTSLVYVALGVARSFEDLPRSVMGVSYPLNEPVTNAGKELTKLMVSIYNFDPTLAPPGKTVLKVMIPTDYAYWKSLRKDPDHYQAEKEKIAETVINLLDQRFPGLAAQVEMRDVATPITWERYTNNWKGSYEG